MIANYNIYIRNKANYHAPYGLIKTLQSVYVKHDKKNRLAILQILSNTKDALARGDKNALTNVPIGLACKML